MPEVANANAREIRPIMSMSDGALVGHWLQEEITLYFYMSLLNVAN